MSKLNKKLIDKLNKDHDNAIITDKKHWDFIPSGISALDFHVGGIPRGTIIELFGTEGSGKTTTALEFSREIYRFTEKPILYVDYEHIIDIDYASNIFPELKLNETFFLVQPTTMESGFDIIREFSRSGEIGGVIVDSVAAMCPLAEFTEGSASDNHMADKARGFGKELRKTNSIFRQYNIPAIFINQVREKVGVMFGNPETTPGGRALKFHAALRTRLSNTKPKSPAKGFETSQWTKFAIKKNKITGHLIEFGYFISSGKGIEKGEELLRTCFDAGIITLNGNTWYYGDQKLGASRKETIKVLDDERSRKTLLKSLKEL
jgi:recombination protein RecA